LFSSDRRISLTGETMKNLASEEIARFRIAHPHFGGGPDELRAWGGVYEIPFKAKAGAFQQQVILRVVASRGGCPFGAERAEHNDWDHVSISTKSRCPTWEEMEFIKRLFFERDECAIQLHVPPRDHVNNHEYCLHIWRPLKVPIPRPPADMVGIEGLTGVKDVIWG
jgi:hypothetical protein